MPPERLPLQTYFCHPFRRPKFDFQEDEHTSFFILKMCHDSVLELAEGEELVNMGMLK
jgi:hypothetical protein